MFKSNVFLSMLPVTFAIFKIKFDNLIWLIVKFDLCLNEIIEQFYFVDYYAN